MILSIEIHVREVIQVVDTLPALEAYVLERIREWFNNSEDQLPLSITLSKKEDRGPPTLGINISENIRMTEALGG
jgi:hypothetical protein